MRSETRVLGADDAKTVQAATHHSGMHMASCLLGEIAHNDTTGIHGSPMGDALKHKDTSRYPKTINNCGERKLMCERCALKEGVRVACGDALGYIRKVVPIKDGCSTTHEQVINFVSKRSTPLPKNAFWRRYPDLRDGDGVVFGVLYTQASQPGCLPKFRSTHMVFKDDPPSDP